jgi:hypothetical protein
MTGDNYASPLGRGNEALAAMMDQIITPKPPEPEIDIQLVVKT